MPVESAGLLRALAEAADGYRTGEEIWISASEEWPYDLEVFENKSDAGEHARAHGWSVFGPYVTDEVEGLDMERTIRKVEIHFNDGTVWRGTPRRCEAIFLTFAAVEKLLIPYYARTRGLDYAKRVWDDVLASGPVCCKPPQSTTDEVWPVDLQGPGSPSA